jgi:hypothetical protein
VIVFVDALGWRLANSFPGFVPALGHRREIATILGFSSGALPTAFSGRPPREHGRWLMYRRAAANGGVFRGFERFAWLPPRLRRSWRLRQWLADRVASRGVRGYFNLYEVPLDELARFDLAERDDLFAPGGLPVDTLWDAFSRRGVAWRGWNWRTPEAAAMAELTARLGEGREDVLFLYTADLDALLHHEGTGGTRVRERLRTYDAFVRSLAETPPGARPRWVYLCSDHGMVDVSECVDVMSALAPLAVRRGRDYDAFFDSTMARFWWRHAGAREAVHAALAGEGRGHWLAAEELAREGADFPERDYGEDIFLLRPGALLVPSFMGSRPVAAMHGYDPGHPDMTALLASNRPLPGDVRHLADLRGFFERELDAAAGAA